MRLLAKNSVVVIAARPMSPSADCTASDPSVLVRGCGDLAEDEASWEGKRSKLLFGVAAWSNSVVDLMTLIASLFSLVVAPSTLICRPCPQDEGMAWKALPHLGIAIGCAPQLDRQTASQTESTNERERDGEGREERREGRGGREKEHTTKTKGHRQGCGMKDRRGETPHKQLV